ncbi:carbon catabolite repressor protein 4-like, partial [Trifolium medium]|nr:carbon catabolite repressor protein 4-like [Trifolium medium]
MTIMRNFLLLNWTNMAIMVSSGNTIDGCATFFRRDRFSHVKKYEVEFNKAAQSLTDAMIPTTQKKTALNRLVK